MSDSKKAFDFARTNLYSVDPTSELCLVGGKSFKLPADQRGPLDTECDASHALFDERLGIELDEMFVNNIDAYGVTVPIIIAKVDGVACVVDGRQRVRAARVVNARRQKRGEPPIKVDAKIRRGDDAGLLGLGISLNEQRTDDETETKIEKLKRIIARGVSIADASIVFGKAVATLEGWLEYDDNAVAAVKKAVNDGKLSISAAHSLSRLAPEKQKEQLDALLAKAPTSGKITRKAAGAAAKSAKKGKEASDGPLGTREVRGFFKHVQDMGHGSAGIQTLTWWQGVEDTLALVLGEDGDSETYKKLNDALTKFRAEKK